MLLKLYKTNRPIVMSLLPLVVLFFWFPNFNKTEFNIENTSPIFKLLITKHSYINSIIGIIILVTTSIVINNFINKNNFFKRNIYIPSFLYIVFMSVFPEFNTIHPVLISNLFVALAFRRLINIRNKKSCKSEIFDSSLFFIFSYLFYPPSIFLGLSIWVSLIIFRPFVFKEWITPILSVFLSLIYFFASLLFTNKGYYYINYFYYNDYYEYKYSNISYIILILVFILSVIGFYKIYKLRMFSSIRFKKMTSTLFGSILISLVFYIFMYVNKNAEETMFFMFIYLVLPISYFFMYFKYKIIAEIVILLLFILAIVNNYFI